MRLFFVDDGDRWGYSHNIVRATDEAEALRLVGCVPGPRVEVIELAPDGPPAILWCRDESPDTGDRD